MYFCVFQNFPFQYYSTIASYLYFNLLADHRLYVITVMFIQMIYYHFFLYLSDNTVEEGAACMFYPEF